MRNTITETKTELRALATVALEVWVEAGFEVTRCPASLMPVCQPNLRAPAQAPASLASLLARRA